MLYITLASAQMDGTDEDNSSIIFGATVLNAAKLLDLDGRVFFQFCLTEDNEVLAEVTMRASDAIEKEQLAGLFTLANSMYPMYADQTPNAMVTIH